MESSAASSQVPPPPQPSITDSKSVVLEGNLLKQGDGARRGLWHERYFVFTKDGTLQYYHLHHSKHGSSHKSNGNGTPQLQRGSSHKSNSKPKASYRLKDLADVEIGDIYVVHQHNKKKLNKVLYCFHLSWAADGTASATSRDDASSSHAPADASVSTNPEEQESSSANKLLLQSPSGPSPRITPKRSPFQRFRKVKTNSHVSDDGQGSTPTHQNKANTAIGGDDVKEASLNVGRSVDEESLTLGSKSGMRHRRRARRTTDHGGAFQASGGGAVELPQIPSHVEVDNTHRTTKPQSLDESQKTVRISNMSGSASAHPNNRTLQQQHVEEDMMEEQEFLNRQYNATQKAQRQKQKRKMVQGTQVALATGVAVGVGVATAGIGLVAGLVVLGVGAAAGGGGAVVNMFGFKRQGEMIIGSVDYEEAKLWKSTLEAYLDSASLQKTRWGQLFVSDGRETRSVLMPQHGSKSADLSTVAEQPSSSPIYRPEILLDNGTTWVPLVGGWPSYLGTGMQGLRIFREERTSNSPSAEDTSSKAVVPRMLFTKMSIDGRPCPPVKASVVMNTAALDAFLCLMSYGRVSDDSSSPMLTPNDGQQASFRRIVNIDEHSDIIHLFFRPLYLFPTWTAPRDFVLFRYWRFEPDGTYIICYESVEHNDCPPHPDFVRGEMHQVFTIAPLKKKHRRKLTNGSQKSQSMESMMSAVVQVDPKGWVPVTPMTAPIPCISNKEGYGDAFGVAALLQLLDIRDAIDQDRFISVSVGAKVIGEVGQLAHAPSFEMPVVPEADSSPESIKQIRSFDSQDEVNDDPVNYDFRYARRESIRCFEVVQEEGFATVPPLLPMERWAEPDANSFRVRGKQYKVDKKKFNAGSSIGRLVAVDVVRVDEPIYSGFSVHPTERLQLALQREEKLAKERGKALEDGESDLPPFVFVVNIVLPATQFFHGVFYFAIDDMSTIDGTNGTPSSKLCNEFFFGDSDEFRDKTFKLIPQIVQGNFIVRKAVGSTPAILGTKIRQMYVKSDRFFEVIVDCASDAVAKGVIRLSLGYAKTLVVDMGFLFEGDDESTLPERILGCARIKNLVFNEQLRKVEAPPPQS